VHDRRPQAGLFQCRLQGALPLECSGVIRGRPGHGPYAARLRQAQHGRGSRAAPDEQPRAAGVELAGQRRDRATKVRGATRIARQPLDRGGLENQRGNDVAEPCRFGQPRVIVYAQVTAEEEERLGES
jgi:hypothetical protein